MKREILFRGKRNNGEWAYGSLVYSATIQPAIYFEVGNGTAKSFDWCYVDPDTVGQYTGLCDKHGNKIFEGDVMKTQFSIEPFGVVRWHINGYWFLDESFGDGEMFSCDSYAPLGELMQRTIDGERIKLEVLGNIYDMKEGL